MNNEGRNRCLVIGLDGASLDLVRAFISEGHLPHLAGLMSKGCYGTLNSTFPPMSPSAWTSFMTGKNPGKHGVFDFTQRLTGTYRAHITSRSNQATLWGILSEYDRRVAVFNVPQTYPVEKVNGLMVTGLGTPTGRPFTHPVELEQELLAHGYRVDTGLRFENGAEREFLETSFNAATRNVAVILPYLQSIDWDLAMVVLRLTDEVPHFFWKYMDRNHPEFEDRPEFADAILRCYTLADKLVGDLVDAAGDATVVIMSDHGFGPLHRDVYLNEWLRREGFLALHTQMSLSGQAARLMRHVGFTRSQIGPLLSRLGLSRLRGMLRTALGTRATLIPNDSRERLSDLVDWRHTKAYSMGYIGQIFANLAGREPEGIVQPGAEYEELLDDLAESLARMTDSDDGLPIVDKVLRRTDVYHGNYVKDAPDLFVLMRGFSYITRESYEWSKAKKYVLKPPTFESGDHRMEGILIMSGPGATSGGMEINAAQIIDLCPTLLHLLGVPIPKDMDGNILTKWMSDGEKVVNYADSKNSIAESESVLSAEDEKNLLNRLRDLGYVE